MISTDGLDYLIQITEREYVGHANSVLLIFYFLFFVLNKEVGYLKTFYTIINPYKCFILIYMNISRDLLLSLQVKYDMFKFYFYNFCEGRMLVVCVFRDLKMTTRAYLSSGFIANLFNLISKINIYLNSNHTNYSIFYLDKTSRYYLCDSQHR